MRRVFWIRMNRINGGLLRIESGKSRNFSSTLEIHSKKIRGSTFECLQRIWIESE